MLSDEMRYTESQAQAQQSIRRSWVITATCGSLLVVFVLSQDGNWLMKLGLSVAGVYGVWSTFWGWRVVWPRWLSFFKNIKLFLLAREVGAQRKESAFSARSLGMWLMVAILFIYIPLVGACVIGCLGGGIYQYIKARDRARLQERRL